MSALIIHDIEAGRRRAMVTHRFVSPASTFYSQKSMASVCCKCDAPFGDDVLPYIAASCGETNLDGLFIPNVRQGHVICKGCLDNHLTASSASKCPICESTTGSPRKIIQAGELGTSLPSEPFNLDYIAR